MLPASLVAPAVPVVQAGGDRQVGAGHVDYRLLGEPDVGSVGVAEDEEVEDPPAPRASIARSIALAAPTIRAGSSL